MGITLSTLCGGFPRVSKKFEKSSKKVLTNVWWRSILVESSGEQRRHDRSLKTIQNQEEREVAIFTSRSLYKDSQFENELET